MQTVSAEVRFARRLASNEPSVRSRAVKRLKQWMASRSALPNSFDELEMLKLWKGLYLTMWHSDKPLVQENLAENIASFVHIFQRTEVELDGERTSGLIDYSGTTVLFVTAFFKILNQEWHSIDRLRLDKFYLLIRKVVSHSFQLLKANHWNEGLVLAVVKLLQEGPLSPDRSKVCCGIQLHVVEVFLTELQKTAVDSISSPVSMVLLEPCCLLLGSTKDSVVAETLSVSIFQRVASSRAVAEQLKVDPAKLSGRLLRLAMHRQTLGRNRKMLYALSKRLEVTDSHPGIREECAKRRKSKEELMN